ncbi:MAG: M14 family zinc carboxypeptidase [bacterium]
MLTLLPFVLNLLIAQDMVVRVYVPSWEELQKISGKPLEIAAGRSGEWFDLVVDRNGLDQVIASGLPYEVTAYSLELEKEEVRGSYLNYTQIVDSLRHLAQNYPALCKMDSLPLRTYEGRWIYGVKISDNVNLDEFEPNFTIDGCHHSREWATPQAVLFFADSMLRSYNTVPEIAEIINTTQIYCFPVINVDGYVYDWQYYQGGWRKNREPFGGGVGTDCNRNYSGACNGEVDGYWGAADEAQVSHYPSDQTFCGAYGFSGDEVRAYAMYIRQHNITTGFSLHSYGEQVMWPWGYKAGGTPDATLYTAKGNYMAGIMQRVGGGTYTPGQSYNNPYPTCGNARDWVYGYNHYVNGLSSLFYGAEIGTAFYEPVANLDFISRQVFKAAKYLAGFSDSLILVAEGVVSPPQIHPLDTVSPNFTLIWHPENTYDNHPTQWELVELSNPSIIEDNLESGSGRWVLQGFSLSTAQHHSGSYSLFSGNTNNMNSVVQTLHPYLVQSGDSLTFWCYYNLENNYDVAVAELSENTKEWFNLDTTRFTGTQTSWVRKAYSLANWVGKSVYFRFRSMTDGNTLNGGFYVDDIRPVCLFGNINVIANNITDTTYTFTNHAVGEYYYYVRGYNTAWGWGDYSCLEKLSVSQIGVSEKREQEKENEFSFLVYPNPFKNHLTIKFEIRNPKSQANSNSQFSNDNVGQGFSLAEVVSSQYPVVSIKIYDISGRLVKSFNHLAANHPPRNLADGGIQPFNRVVWHGDDDLGRRLPSGVYFVRLEVGDYKQIEKVILLR